METTENPAESCGILWRTKNIVVDRILGRLTWMPEDGGRASMEDVRCRRCKVSNLQRYDERVTTWDGEC